MAEAAHLYKTTLPPHSHSMDSLARRNWGQCAALTPLFITACFTGHAEILRLLLICLVSAIAFEFLTAKLFRKKENLRNGETVLAAVLFALLMPSRCPSEAVILGIFMALVAGKELWGGTGSYLLHPLLLARVFLQLCFPQLMAEPMLLTGGGNMGVLAAVGLGGIFLLKQRQGYRETPVLFTLAVVASAALRGSREMSFAFLSGVLFTAFFILADPAAMPLTRRGTIFFVLGAALLSSQWGPNASLFLQNGSLDCPQGFSIRSAGPAILFMNLLTPWFDLWFKPMAYKHPPKAANPA